MSSVYGGSSYDSIGGGSTYESIGGSSDYESLNNSSSYVSLSGAGDYDGVVNTGNYVTIYGGADDNKIYNSGENVVIYGESGNDYISNNASDSVNNASNYASIYGGAGNDTIYNSVDNVIIYGGEGNDHISISVRSGVDYVSVYGGAGNDTVDASSEGANAFFFGKGDGADVINNASSGDVVYLYDVNLYDVTSLNTANHKISIGLSSGDSLQISSSENISPVLTLADNSSFKFNHSTNNWIATSYASGTAGNDVFNYGKNDGDYIISNASSSDTVNLYDISLTDITSLDTSNNKVSIGLNTGGSLQINSSDNLSATFNLASGGSFKFNHSANQWQSA